MIQLLFLVLFAEGVVAFLLMVKIGPLRELVMKGMDHVKMGKGPATLKTIAGTMFSGGPTCWRLPSWKLTGLRSIIGASKKEVERLEKEKLQLKEKEEKATEELKLLREEISSLTENLKKLKLEFEEKDKRVETAEAHVTSLQKQAADLLLEYDRLLEENQNMQTQSAGYRS